MRRSKARRERAEWRSAVVRRLLDIRAAIEELLRHFEEAAVARHVQRRTAALVRARDVGAVLEQELDDGLVPAHTSEDERCSPELVGALEVNLALFEALPHNRHITFAACHPQRVLRHLLARETARPRGRRTMATIPKPTTKTERPEDVGADVKKGLYNELVLVAS